MKRALVIDDDPVMRELIRETLLGEFEVETVGSGYRAMLSTQGSHFDLITLDLLMPGIDGLETLAHIKELTPATPVIIVTGLQMRSLHESALRAGAYSVVMKPFGAMQLLNEARTACSGAASASTETDAS